ncbi:MAG: hypothetical protein DRQ48_11710 [Gammaproteobacteria bacterium]|nr:MAG: hypothetical protein DRQ48_11710 [Gammaproteobacteria bacterium]
MAKKPEDHKQDDQNLDKYLQGDSALSRAYVAEAKAQAPTHFDKAILSAASEAVRSKPESKVAYSPFARSWYVPASMAAVLMLCVGLVFTIYKDSEQTLLTAPKSEFDIDAQTVPVETVKSIGRGRINAAGEKDKKYKYEDDAIPMDVIQEANKPVPSSIEIYEAEEPELEKRSSNKMLMREKVMEMDDAFQSEIKDKNAPKKDTSEQTLSDAPYSPERQDDLRRIEAADVKQQEQIDADELSSKIGGGEFKTNEEQAETGTTSAPALRYRQAKESFAKGKRTADEESLDNATVEGLVSPARSSGNEMMSAEQWLKQINDLWLSGDHQAAKESLNQFLVAYPDYPEERIEMILDPESGLMDYIR